MISLIKNKFAVFGNPIKHSLSPLIHDLFSRDLNIVQEYISIFTPVESFEDYLSDFFLNFGKGANITVPFKKRAFLLSDILTEKAKLSGSVNTLKKTKDNLILGENTDGVGLMYDLKRLNYIRSNSKILLIGAGGAAYAVVPELLFFGCSIYVTNRTLTNSENMVVQFNKLGKIYCLDSLISRNHSFDLIINATSSSMYNSLPEIPTSIINSKIFCYDMYYDLHKTTCFLAWCKKNGALFVSDGLGMLVSQAAYSFYLWHKKFPKIEKIISILRQ